MFPGSLSILLREAEPAGPTNGKCRFLTHRSALLAPNAVRKTNRIDVLENGTNQLVASGLAMAPDMKDIGQIGRNHRRPKETQIWNRCRSEQNESCSHSVNNGGDLTTNTKRKSQSIILRKAEFVVRLTTQ